MASSGCDKLLIDYWVLQSERFPGISKQTSGHAFDNWAKYASPITSSSVKALFDKEAMSSELQALEDASAIVMQRKMKKTDPLLSVMDAWAEESASDAALKGYASVAGDGSLSAMAVDLLHVNRCATGLKSMSETVAMSSLSKAISQWRTGRALITIFRWYQKRKLGKSMGQVGGRLYLRIGFNALHSRHPSMANLCGHIEHLLSLVQSNREAGRPLLDPAGVQGSSPLNTSPIPPTPLHLLPGDLYGLQTSSRTAQIDLSKGKFNAILQKNVDASSILPDLVDEVLTAQLVDIHLKKYDTLFKKPHPNTKEENAVNRCIIRGALLSCIVEAVGSDAILTSNRIAPLLLSPNFFNVKTCKSVRDARRKILNDLEGSTRPLISAMQELLDVELAITIRKMGDAVHGCAFSRYMGIANPKLQKDPSRRGSSTRKPVFGAVVLSATVANGVHVVLLNLLIREALLSRRGQRPAIDALARVLRGQHSSLSSNRRVNPDHTNPCRHYNELSKMVNELFSGRALTGPFGLSNLMAFFGTGQGARTQRFQTSLEEQFSDGFWSESTADCVTKFERGLCQMASDPASLAAAVEEFLVADMRAWGQASNSLSLQPTLVGTNGRKVTMEEKFDQYFNNKVYNCWIHFLGDMANQEFDGWGGPKNSWKATIDMVQGLNISGMAGLTALQMVNSMALLGLVTMPTGRELADWIWERPKLGAFKGLELLGFTMENTNSTRFAFDVVHNWLDGHLSALDKVTLGFSAMFVEHLLCKIARWNGILVREGTEEGLMHWEEEVLAGGSGGGFACPNVLEEHELRGIFDDEVSPLISARVLLTDFL